MNFGILPRCERLELGPLAARFYRMSSLLICRAGFPHQIMRGAVFAFAELGNFLPY